MKVLTVALLCLFSFNSFSNDKPYKNMEKMMDKMSFEEAKKMKLEMLDKHTAMFEKERTCINAASDKPALKTCMKEMKEEKEKMEEEMK